MECLFEKRKQAWLHVDSGLDQQLKSVCESDKALSKLLEQFESTSYTIKEAYIALLNTNFKEDLCDMKSYIRKRISGSNLEAIIRMDREDISPAL